MRLPLCLALAGIALASTAAHAQGPATRPLAAEVDPMIGVGPEHGSCPPGPCLPNGSIHPSPDTREGRNSGFVPGSPVVGFSQLHAAGAGGVPSYGNLLLSPQIGLQIDEKHHASPVDQVRAGVDAFSCRLTRYDIAAAVAPARHAAIYTFTFPASVESTLTLDVARKITKDQNHFALRKGRVEVDPVARRISGSGTYVGSWTGVPYDLFYVMEVDSALTSCGTWGGTALPPGKTLATEAAGPGPMGAFLKFDTLRARTVTVKIAVSFKSIDQAQHWLDEEIPAWDFEKVKADAAAAWEKVLGLITLEGVAPAERAKVYTALYHTMLQPRDRTGDVAGWAADEQFYDEQYTLWDTWKTEYPLIALLRPDLSRDIIESFINRQKHNGRVEVALLAGGEAEMFQGGDEVDNVIADAFVKKVPGVDWPAAYGIVAFNATRRRTPDYRSLGYASIEEDVGRRRSGSATLAFAYNDFCASELAAGLGKSDAAARWLARSGNWASVWDPSAVDGDFHGFVRSRHRDGTFSDSPSQSGRDFYQGTAWNYSFNVPHALPALMEKMGGRERFVARLEEAFDRNRTDYTNEPGFMLTWWFCAAGRPDLASRWAAVLRQQYTAEGYPGDDDSGAMSSLYLFASAGLFPVAGQDIYYLHGAAYPQIAFHLPGDKTFTITSANASPANLYVQSATLNGKSLDVPLIHHSDLTAGGELHFEMGPRPSDWGRVAQ